VKPGPSGPETIPLPEPRPDGPLALEGTLAGRRSVREFTPEPLTLAELSQLLWAAQGVTDRAEDLRTAPSAGALYPLELYVATADGLGHYQPRRHELWWSAIADPRPALARAALNQEGVGQAAAVFLLAGVVARTEAKYGPDARRYLHFEVGHAAQNLLLQAVALDLGAFPVGAFGEREVRTLLSLPRDHEPLYLVAVGKRRGNPD